MLVLIAQILCAVEVKKSSVALGVAYGNRNVNAIIKKEKACQRHAPSR